MELEIGGYRGLVLCHNNFSPYAFLKDRAIHSPCFNYPGKVNCFCSIVNSISTKPFDFGIELQNR